jgi:hypothetical protein
MLLILVVLLSAGSGVYAGASFFAQQGPGVTVTTTIYTTTTSWTTSTIWSTVTEVVQGVLTTVQYTTSTSTITVTGSTSYPTSTFGYTTAGNSKEWAGYLILSKKNLAVPGTVQSMSVYSAVVSDVKVGIYSDNGGSPNSLVAGPYTSAVGPGWNTITFTTPVYLTAGNYWLAIQLHTYGAVTYKSGTSSAVLRYTGLSWGSAWPNPAGSGFGSASYEESVYATYIQT